MPDAEAVEPLPGAVPGLRPRYAVGTEPVRGVRQRGEVREEGAVLRDPRDAPPVRGQAAGVGVPETQCRVGARRQAEQRAQQGRLARAVRADDGDRRTRLRFEGELVETGDLGAQRPALAERRGSGGGSQEVRGLLRTGLLHAAARRRGGAGRPGPSSTQGEEHRHGDGQQEQRDGGGRLGGLLEQQIHLQGQGLRGARQIAREGDGRAELTQRPCPGERRAGGQSGSDHGQGHGEEHAYRGGAEGRGRLLVPRMQAAQGPFEADDEERHRDEGRGEDRPRGVERQRDAERVLQPGAEQPPPPEGEQQCHTADRRRKHHGQQDERAYEGLAGEVDAGQQPGEGHAQHERQPERPAGDEQRQLQGLCGAGTGQMRAELAPVRARQDAGQRQHQEHDGEQCGNRQGERGTGARRAGAELFHGVSLRARPGRHGFWKPASRRIFCASGVDSQDTNAAAASLFPEDFSVAAG